jgi:peptidoglycan/xylan/chitin deacetylase (PgdA/CDA1 family)
MILAIEVVLQASCCSHHGAGVRATAAAHGTAQADQRNPSSQPPAGLSPKDVPLFVVFGFDDNGHSGTDGSGGVHYVNELFRGRRNPTGRRFAGTFDSAPAHYTLYAETRFIAEKDTDAPENVKREWRAAADAGHEIAMHTHTHPHGRGLTRAEWYGELTTCRNWLTKPFNPETLSSPQTGIGVAAPDVIGFRTPFLEYNDAAFDVMAQLGLHYDCSIEEGWQSVQDGTNYDWPYTLDHGSPGNAATVALEQVPLVTKHPGLWELPVYAWIAPPDEACEGLGVPRGFRARLRKSVDSFDAGTGKITGMDWNLWIEFGMTKAEFLATLKYTLGLRMAGNRAPLMVGAHSHLYSERENAPHSTGKERQEALREVFEYALANPAVRVVSARELLTWLTHPMVKLEQAE